MKDNQERWMELAEQAAKEQDPAKLLALVIEINQLLAQKSRRLTSHPRKEEDGTSK